MMRNEKAIKKLKAHLHMVYGLASDLNGEFGDASRQLMKLYGMCFNHIILKLMPALGMTNDEIVDFVTELDNDLEVFGDTLPGA